MTKLRLAAFALAVLSGSPTAALAGDDDPAFLAFGAGWYDVDDNQDAGEFRAEWRGTRVLWILKPQVGAMATTDGALYGYGGFLADFYFGKRWVLTPSLSAGLYYNGDGKDLGYPLEFRSAIELSYRFDDRSRLGLQFYHISNASLGDENPGTEVLSATYAIPLR